MVQYLAVFESLYQYIVSCADTLDRELLVERGNDITMNESLRDVFSGDDESEVLQCH